MMAYPITPEVAHFISRAPADTGEALSRLRDLIINTAAEMAIDDLSETLKWGEPAWLSQHGSTLRLGWKPTTPTQYALYFHCKTRLIPTCRALYGNLFTFEGNRAIIFQVNQTVPSVQLKHCISLALTYHQIKHLPLLGT